MRVRYPNRAVGMSSAGAGWLAYWEHTSGQNAWMCYSKGCIDLPSVGALVQRDSPMDDGWYVVPLCEGCSREAGLDLEIWDLATLVSVLDSKVPSFSPRRRMPPLHARRMFSA